MPQRTIEFDTPFLEALDQQRQSSGAQAKLQRYLSLLQPKPGESILDLGCGSGAHCRAIAPLVAPTGNVAGVDIEPEAIALAESLSSSQDRAAVSYSVAEGERLPFADGTFDAVICISVLAFVDNPVGVLTEIKRVLRSDGRLVLANSDEDTRIFNVRDRDLGRRMTHAMADRAQDPWVGRRLAWYLSTAGFSIVEDAVTVDVERRFAPGQGGYAIAHALRPYLISCGSVTPDDYERWLADLEACEREGSYCYSVTTFACLAIP